MKTLIYFLLPMLFTSTFTYAQYNAGANSGSSGAYHTFLGRFAGQKNTTGSHNTFVGQAAGINNTTGVSNTFIGRAAGATNTGAHYNTFVGRSSGFYNTTADYSTFIGYRAGFENTIGVHNTFIGAEAGYKTKSTASNNGHRNTYLGFRAGYNSVTGRDNVFLGYRAGYNTLGNRNVFIGFQAGYQETGSNKLYIANSFTTDPLIYGNFSTSELKINGKLRVTNNLTVDNQISANTIATDDLVVLEDMLVQGGLIVNDNLNANKNLRLPSSGNIYLGGTTNINQNGMRLFGGDLTSSASSGGYIDVTAGSASNPHEGLYFRVNQNDGGTERMRITSVGNVGIGTPAPDYKLDVNGDMRVSGNDIYGSGNLVLRAGGSGFVETKPSGSDYGLVIREYNSTDYGNIEVSAGGLGLGYRTKEAHMMIDINGNVGIGTPGPQSKLDVNGDTNISGGLAVYNQADFKGRVNVDNVVAIGPSSMTTPGGYKLYVKDGILTEKVRIAGVTSLQWADYVFEPDYNLNSIEEVEQFVKENKHLPNVPSAKQVEKNGVDIVEMDATLLRQIEELWLHVIELKKQNDALKVELTELKK